MKFYQKKGKHSHTYVNKINVFCETGIIAYFIIKSAWYWERNWLTFYISGVNQNHFQKIFSGGKKHHI